MKSNMRIIRTLLALFVLAIPVALSAQFGVRIVIAPPALLVYDQPVCPGDGYIWTPGYWAYDDSVSDYYWVAGAWVEAPEVGYLWTPGYWGWNDGYYAFKAGYWGMNVGFYGGVNYGFGYFGDGFGGGRWDHGHFFYNRAVSNVNININHNVYETRIENSGSVNRVSYNGGAGGLTVHANAAQESAGRERHIAPIARQTENEHTARVNPETRASVTGGKAVPNEAQRGEKTSEPRAEAPRTEKATESKTEVTKSATENTRNSEPTKTSEIRPATHPKDLAPINRPAAINSGNTKADQKYEQKQDQLITKQTNERQQLQQKQENEHQQKSNEAQTQQLEQKHQQQTQQQQEKHTTQQRTLESHQPQQRAAQPQPKTHK